MRGDVPLATSGVTPVSGSTAIAWAPSRVAFTASAFDPLAYTLVIVTIAATGVTAVLIPALQAIRVDPVRALRAE